MGLILHDVDVAGERVAVRIEDGAVASVGSEDRSRSSGEVIDGRGGALLAGLHDHHLHVLALAAARRSISVSASTTNNATFAAALRDASTRGPVRAVGYHERVFGGLDRDVLDGIVRGVPVRVQHRTGGLWILNSCALEQIEPSRLADARFERDHAARLTGRLWRGDDLVRDDAGLRDGEIAAIGSELAAVGVTAVTDATASNDPSSVACLRALPQRVRVMGPIELALDDSERLTLGEVKVVPDDDDLPDIDDLVRLVLEAHGRGRGVAVHCVTLVQVRFAIEAFRVAGVRGDRIEHASVAPADVIADLHALGLTVVTQPAFVSARGDEYMTDVDPRDVAALYPTASLLAAGVPTRGSSDAPYGPIDPWEAMRAAVQRRTARGTVVGASERIRPSNALALFTGSDTVRAGLPADLVLLSVPLSDALARLRRDDVVLTIVGGAVVYDARERPPRAG
ncbi:MAG: Amidohydrolase 3 [Actinomycetia bacterium]|nr:Amidohydrolase 3 [Actinomycetes bacterium]